MALPRRTTKQLASRYRGNLDYLRKPHILRTTKLVCFLLAGAASLALAFKSHQETLFSTGPISANHKAFAERCDVCHEGAQPSLWKALTGTKIGHDGKEMSQSFSDRLGGVWASMKGGRVPEHMTQQLQTTLTTSNSLGALDAACLKCHEPMKLHQPQFQSLGLRPVRNEISAAEVASCSSCHREHEGPAKMKDPPSSNCTDCHGNPERLRETLVTFKVNGGHPPTAAGDVLDFKKDGVKRFAPPRESPHEPVAFLSFKEGHPAFGYEQAGVRDPAKISFNHSRHFQKDIPAVDTQTGRRLDCTDCHQPGADGMFMRPVQYEAHCSTCHSLHFFADLPELKIPHKQPQRVHDSMTGSGLTVMFLDYAVKEKKITDTAQQQVFISEQFQKLKDRGVGTTDALLARVFRTGDPPNAKQQFFPGCVKCHELTNPPGNATPVVTPTNIADRWLVRGPFNHQPHQHMLCTECHGAALTSVKTSDILMPSQESCAACHQPFVNPSESIPFQKVEATRVNKELTKQQQTQGGISNECQFCHPRYHAPADATVFAKSAQRVK